MWLDLASLGILILFAWLGARKGALPAATGLLALVGAYGSAVVLSSPVSEYVRPMVGDRNYLALPLAGTLVFVATFLLLSVIGTLAQKIALSRRKNDERDPIDRLLGALLGFARGALIVFLLGALGLWLDAARELGAVPGLPNLSHSATAAIASSTIESGAKLALSDGASPTTRAAVQMMAHPKESVVAMRSLLEEPAIQNLIRDSLFWNHIERGDIETAIDTEVFQEIARNPATRGRFFDLGLIDTQAAANPNAFGDHCAEVFEQVVPRLQAIKQDPEFQDLMADPALTEAAQNGDAFALLSHSGFRHFVDRVLSGDVQAAAATPRASQKSQEPQATQESQTPPETQTPPTPRSRTYFVVHDSAPSSSEASPETSTGSNASRESHEASPDANQPSSAKK